MKLAKLITLDGNPVAINPAQVASVYHGRTYNGSTALGLPGETATHVVMANGVGYPVQGTFDGVVETLEETAAENACMYIEQSQ